MSNQPQGRDNCDHAHGESMLKEMMEHLPYAIMSVSFGFVILSFCSFGFSMLPDEHAIHHISHNIFHSFHFMHIVFAVTGTMITFFRFSRNVWQGLLLSIISPTFFCILSDIMFPYLAGTLLGVDMELHICFWSELHNVLPFMLIGLLQGLALAAHGKHRLGRFSIGSHAIHIFISSMASMFYLVGHGLANWFPYMGMLFLLMIVAVVVPCTLSDVIIPIYVSRIGNKNAKHSPK